MSGIIGNAQSRSGLVYRYTSANTMSSYSGAANTAGTIIAVQTQLVDAGGNQNSNGTYTCPVSGAYMCMCTAIGGSGGSGNIAISLYKNGSGIGEAAYSIGAQFENANMHQIISATAGQYFYWKTWSGYRDLQSGYINVTFYLMD